MSGLWLIVRTLVVGVTDGVLVINLDAVDESRLLGGIGCVPILIGGLDRLAIYFADVVIDPVLVVVVDPQFLPVGCVHPHQPVDGVVVVAVVHAVDQVLVPQEIAVGVKLVAEGGIAVVIPLDLSAVLVVVELHSVPIAVGGGVEQAVVD